MIRARGKCRKRIREGRGATVKRRAHMGRRARTAFARLGGSRNPAGGGPKREKERERHKRQKDGGMEQLPGRAHTRFDV